MTRLTAGEVAALLREYGQRTALRGGNAYYRARAYETAAVQVAAVGDELDDLVRRGELKSIPGVGDAIADLIVRLYRTGTDPKLEQMRKKVPEGVLEMLGLPGIRSEQVLRIYKEAGIDSLAALESALKSGALTGKKGFTAAFQKKLLNALQMRARHGNAVHIHRAWIIADNAVETLVRNYPNLERVTVAGECRRQCELVGDIVLVAASEAGKGDDIALGERVTVRVRAPGVFGSTLLFATGSAAHLEALQKRAELKGMRLGPEGLTKGGKIIAAATEQEIYKALGLPFIAPELREAGDEFRIVKQKTRLVALEDLKGVLHAHTVSSDGADTLEVMADAALARGFQYLGITDHSQSAHYAGGLSPEEIIGQQREADRLNRRYGDKFHIFKGIESDIRADGSLDYPDDILREFDFTIASVHGQFRMESGKQTARIIQAVENPYTTILGHLTGRQLLRRPGYETDIEAILKACAAHGVAVEINAHPWRLDIDWRWHQMALKFGCLMSIDPDAHSTDEIDNLRWGVAMARKGGVPRDRVLSCFDRKAFATHIEARKAAAIGKRKGARRRVQTSVGEGAGRSRL